MQTVELLFAWTPYLLGGFAWNLAIAVLAAIIGTAVGALLTVAMFSERTALAASGRSFASFLRNVPTLVLMFYLATLIPGEVSWFDGAIAFEFPVWLKAALALAASPAGFTAWNLHSSICAWRERRRRAALLFLPNWLAGFLIVLLASSTASLLGVSELVGRCNTIIGATGSRNMLSIYLYASAIYSLAGLLISRSVDWLRAAVVQRVV
jgi:polar amino acid transport system permease protein